MRFGSICAFFSLVLSSQVAFTTAYATDYDTTYKEQLISPNDFKVETNQKVVAKLRLRLVREADKIDVIDYDVGGDKDLAIPFFEALRYSANRGAQVRFVRGGFISKLYRKFYKEPHWTDPVEEYLVSNPTRNPIQYVFFGGWQTLIKGWSLSAGIHQKLVITHLRNGNVVVFLPGHGMSKEYLRYQDHCTIFKGKENEGIIQDVQDTFENVWKVVHREMSGVQSPSPDQLPGELSGESSETVPDSSDLPELRQGPEIEEPVLNFSNDPALPLDSSARAELRLLKRWAHLAPEEAPKENPVRVQLLHPNLIEQIKETCKGTPWIYGYMDCSNHARDPILDQLVGMVEKASTFKLFTLGLHLHPRLKKAILDRLDEAKKRKESGDESQFRDFHLKILTNSREAYKAFIFYPLSKFAWNVGLKDMDDFLQYRNEGQPNSVDVEIYAFESNPEKNNLVYVHEKGAIAILPDGNMMATTGSHNANQASSKVNDELNLLILSTETARKYNTIFDEAVAHNGQLQVPSAIHNELWWDSLPVWGSRSVVWHWLLDLAATLI